MSLTFKSTDRKQSQEAKRSHLAIADIIGEFLVLPVVAGAFFYIIIQGQLDGLMHALMHLLNL